MRTLFAIKIGVDEKGKYGFEMLSLLDHKRNRGQANRMPQLLKLLSKRLIARLNYNRKFPPQPESVIITPGSVRDQTPRLIIPGRN